MDQLASYDISTYPFLIRFAHQHLSFRIPEFLSLCDLFGVRGSVRLLPDLSYLESCPFLPIGGITEDVLVRIVSRSILVQQAFQIFSYGSSPGSLFSNSKAISDEDMATYKNSSFKFIIDPFGKSLRSSEQSHLINSFSFLPLDGRIDLQNPEVTFAILACLSSETWPSEHESWFFGRRVGCMLTFDSF